MQLSGSFWSYLTYLANFLTLSPFDQSHSQQPLGNDVRPVDTVHVQDYPVFKPPTGRVAWEGSEFVCNYSRMPDYEFCGDDIDHRGCWLRPKDPSKGLPTFDINTDYEKFTPLGTTQYYEFTINNGTINADGLKFMYEAKLINNQYPGPWVQACWGDRIVVKVNNQLLWNGTAIHWHGIRQHDTMQMDGVPGITQCPIKPKDYFDYDFEAKQYGSAWYHSHYSVQYADGMLGPLTIHGPSSGDFDEPRKPLLMTDWFHNSAFQVIHKKAPGYPTILLNGTGNINHYGYSRLIKDRQLQKVTNDTLVPPQYRLHFNRTLVRPDHPDNGKRAPRYLLSLINTAFDTTFLFSIDHHILQVISADFVPIQPYNTTHLFIGIGQRYNVIVYAQPVAYPDNSYGGEKRNNFWIRTAATTCFQNDDKLASLQGYDQTGVLTYHSFDHDDPYDDLSPVTQRWPEIPEKPNCEDELVTNLVPIHKWNVLPPSNGEFDAGDGTGTSLPGERLDVVGNFMLSPKPKKDKDFPLAVFSIEQEGDNIKDSFVPMQIDYEDPILLHLNDTENETKNWPKKWTVLHENRPAESWIWLAIAGRYVDGNDIPGWTGGAHPMHLHGHDFAILQQAYNKPLNSTNFKPNTKNPARRDVVLLPASGFVVIAFKADNPGSWIMHCHIAFHASEGLALQIMENKAEADALWPPSGKTIKEAERVCRNWQAWKDDCTQNYPGWNEEFQCYPACNNATSTLACPNLFQDDSGI